MSRYPHVVGRSSAFRNTEARQTKQNRVVVMMVVVEGRVCMRMLKESGDAGLSGSLRPVDRSKRRQLIDSRLAYSALNAAAQILPPGSRLTAQRWRRDERRRRRGKKNQGRRVFCLLSKGGTPQKQRRLVWLQIPIPGLSQTDPVWSRRLRSPSCLASPFRSCLGLSLLGSLVPALQNGDDSI